MENILLKSFTPEIFLSISILFQLIFNIRLLNNLKYNFPLINKEFFIQLFFILVCISILLINLKIDGFFLNFIFLNDESSRILKLFFIFISLLSLIVIIRSFNLQNLNFFEFFIIFSLSLLSSLLLLSSYDLLSSYLVIEMQALCFYVLASYRRNSAYSTEAGLKYFISGSFISGIFLFGCSMLYGCLGTLNFNDINILLSFLFLQNDILYLKFFILIGVLSITITLLFKVTAAPFHFWVPDVYEGSPLSTTIIFSIFPKLIIFSFFIKWVSVISTLFYDINFFLSLIGLISLFVGTFFAIQQKRLKRFFIFSSISQVGFLIVALSIQNLLGYISIYFYLIVYIITSILLWSFLTLMYTSQKKLNSFNQESITPLFISNLENFFNLNSIWSFSLVVIFFSMSGVPPFSGFFSKLFVLFNLLQDNQILISIFFVIISSVSVFYYLRILKIIFFENKNKFSKKNYFQTTFLFDLITIECTFLSILLFLLIFFFFYPTNLLLMCQYIILNFFFF